MAQYRYPGAQPFAASQEHLFFGREQDIEALYRQIRLEPLVVLYSKSGLGKSSLLNAGLTPRVTQEGKYRPVKIRFNACNPQSDNFRTPLDAMLDALAAVDKESEKNVFLEKLLASEDSLWFQIKSAQAQNKRRPFLLLFDQFEELFTYPEQAVLDFKRQLAELLDPQIPQRFLSAVEREVEKPVHLSPEELALLHQAFEVRIIFAIRSDRISLLDKLADYLPDVKRSWYELDALTPEQAEDAILNPAYKKGVFASPIFDYEDEAIEKMLGFLTKGGEQKIESFQLQILCQAVERKVIRQGLKIVTAADLGNIEEAYENYYDDQIRLIEKEEEQLAARRFIEEGLIFEEEERRLSLYEGQIFRQYGLSEALLRKLEDTHLVRREPSSKGGYTYELSHDTLVAPVLRAKEQRLLAERRVQEEAERLRQEKALAEAQRKAEEERELRKKAEQNEKRARQRTRLAAILSLLAVLLAFFAIRSYLQSIQANKRVVLSLLEDVDASMLDMDYEKALYNLHTAAKLKVQKESVFTRYFELVYWYNESGDARRASGILDTGLMHMGKKNLAVDSTQGSSRTGLQNSLRALNESHYNRMQRRYYPYMIEIKGGAFMMGCDSAELKKAYGEDCLETQHEAVLGDYSMAETETTLWQFGLYCAATGKSIDRFRPNWRLGGDHPVVDVSWYDALDYANWLSKRLERDTVYRVILGSGEAEADWTKDDFRLPSEAEWEYAARAGQSHLFAGTSSLDSLYLFANYGDDNGAKDGYPYTSPVKTYRPNDWGLYDMSGNAWEWCWDRYVASTPPYYGAEERYDRVLRGGSWDNREVDCRLSLRYGDAPGYGFISSGFRLARY